MGIKKYLLAILVSLVFIVIPKDTLKVQAEDITLGYSNPLGDMNYDSKIDVLDVMALKDELLNDSFDRRGRYTADLNIDNEVTYMDVMLLKKAVLNLYSIINGYGGYCGNRYFNNVEDVKYFYNEDTNTLTLCGDGFIDEYEYGFRQYLVPWYDITDKIKHVVVSGRVKNICAGCFYECENLVDVYMPNVARLEDDAFYGCKSLKTLDLSNNIKYMSICAFYGCTSLETVNLDADIESVEWETFSGCTNLKNLNITTNSIKSIDGYAFEKCAVTEVFIPDSVEVLNYSAFAHCPNLTKLTMSKNTKFDGSNYKDDDSMYNPDIEIVRYYINS